MLKNLKNYGPMVELVTNNQLTINTDSITSFNWDDYYNGTLNILKDGIETDFVHTIKIDIVFGTTGVHCRLTLMDFYFNIIMWYLIIRIERRIEPKHLFFPKAITKNSIKNFIDKYFILPYREKVDFKLMNNLIDDTLHNLTDVDIFSMYIGSTVNLEDFVSLMVNNKDFDRLMHVDLDDENIEDVKDKGMEYTHEAIDIIKNSKKYIGYDHCLADSFRSKEGTNIKQFKEFAINVGSKPDGNGGAYPMIINHSYLNGGLNQLAYQFIDSSASRYAQIIAKNKVGDSGNFARIVGLNSINTTLYPDMEYDCHTKNFLKLTITSMAFLKLYTDRYYRFNPDGQEFLCHGNEESLLGKTLYFRSPETCASEARGHGICARCYGKLIYAMQGVKPGKMAAELVTNKTTQERLSSKHLLETRIKKFVWNDNFNNFLDVNGNAIVLKDSLEFNDDWSVVIDKNDIKLDNDIDYSSTFDDDEFGEGDNGISVEDSNYNEYCEKFYIVHNPDKQFFEVSGLNELYKMYISNTLNKTIRSCGIPLDDRFVQINFSDIENDYLFFLKIENNELGKSLNDIQNLMDKKDVTQSHTYNSLTQALIEAAIEGKLGIMAVHFEVLIMNQIRNVNSSIHKPNWEVPNEPYQLLTLKQALMDNPSVSISLLYQYVDRALFYPLTFKKNAPSFMDLFFMKKPQSFMYDTSNIKKVSNKKEKVRIAVRVHKPE